ncbi:class IV adenylate cyclase [Micromonospora zhanjiangensis]|uniref:Class IV adenylate cyclase n=1 Tax=Micromonospora zhanjiangensis TaxID=1522057 RepID=A0ABV8KMS3_9ACTN
MSDDIREIEVKYRIMDVGAVLAALRQRGVTISAPVEQDDQAYAMRGWAYGQSRAGLAFARLRTQSGRHTFCVKQPLDNELACAEHETEVADRAPMHAAILAMGFYPTTRIVKTRRTGRLGHLSLCLDEVAGLGSFLEIEALVSDKRSGVEVQRELDEFARSLGVDLERSTDTYDSLVHSAQAVGV